MKDLFVTALVLFAGGLCFAQQSQDKWTIVVSPISVEQQEGVILKGPVRPIYWSAILLEAPIARRHFLRFQARRVDWSMSIESPDASEYSDERGFDARAGYGYRISNGQKFHVRSGADIAYRRTTLSGEFLEGSTNEPILIDHVKHQYIIAPFASMNYKFWGQFSIRLEMGINLAITDLDDKSNQGFPPNDVFSGGTIAPLSIFGLAYSW